LLCPLQNANEAIKLPISENTNLSMFARVEKTYELDDYLRCIIENINDLTDVCEVSLVNNQNNNIKLGIIKKNELPLHYLNL
jgi:hypothetical protein